MDISTGATTVSVSTDHLGYATAPPWTLGDAPGVNRLSALVEGLRAVHFTVRTLDPATLTWLASSKVDWPSRDR